MGRSAKIMTVVAGYIAALLAAVVAAWAYDVRVGKLPYDTSGGMYAGGQLMTSAAVFLLVALAPTVLALWFLRRHTGFWNGVAIVSVVFAGTGLVAVLTSLVYRGTPRGLPLMMVELVGLSQLLGVPLWFGAFVLFAVVAPTREIREKLAVAIAIEAVIAAFAFVHWFLPQTPV